MISSVIFPVSKYKDSEVLKIDDHLAVEEPLEIRISFLNKNRERETRSLSVTMRTPGHDEELAAGFLLTEGIIRCKKDITEVSRQEVDVVTVELADDVAPDLNKLERHFYTTSSCGVCGKTSIDAVKIAAREFTENNLLKVSPDIIYTLPDKLRMNQDTFEFTGGLHAVALFDEQGSLKIIREDVGRHNALDKLIGSALNDELIPLNKHVLLLSGRASFELIQKATMSGITFVCAVGAPSSLAVELSVERKITLIGFLRSQRFNIYCGDERVV